MCYKYEVLASLPRLIQPKLTLPLILIAGVVTLMFGYALKAPCLFKPWGGSERVEYSWLCYNDLQPLYGVRNLHERRIPYIEERTFEYPVLIGLDMYLASLLSSNHVEFFHANLPFLTASALLSILALWLAVDPAQRKRTLWFAIGPPLVLYAFHNWDLLAAVFLSMGMLAWTRGRQDYCGLALGSGVAAKLYPGFVLPALMIERWRNTSGAREPLTLAFWTALGWAMWNVPVMIATAWVNGDISGWLETYRFHSRRFPDLGTVWYWWADRFTDHPWLAIGGFLVVLGAVAWILRDWWKADRRWAVAYAGGITALWIALLFVPAASAGAVTRPWKNFVDLASFTLFASATAGLLWRQRRKGADPWCVAGAIVATFLLVSKVHSPQYTLWLLPFLVITNVPGRAIAFYLASDLMLYVSVFKWYAVSPHLEPQAWQTVFIASVYARELAIALCLAWLVLKGTSLLRAAPDPARSPALPGAPSLRHRARPT